MQPINDGQIKALEKEGLTPLQIAGELGLDPRTVYHWLAQERFTKRPGDTPPKIIPTATTFSNRQFYGRFTPPLTF